MKHLITLRDLAAADIAEILQLAVKMKQQVEQGIREPVLAGRVLGLLFEKPSLRTRVSFESGMAHLGGSSLYLGPDVGWGSRESAADFARVRIFGHGRCAVQRRRRGDLRGTTNLLAPGVRSRCGAGPNVQYLRRRDL